MERFTRLEAIAVPLARPNVDTDQIIPSRYLQKPRSDDFGMYLFRDVRFRPDGTETVDFVLNQPTFRAARIVVAERNFGCGSSREQAVWALYDYGIRAAIAPSFGDIFANNAAKNGLLAIVLPETVVRTLIGALERAPGARIGIDLPAQTLTGPDGETHRFDVDPFVKHCLLEGLDEIDYTLTLLDHIVAFEARHAREGL